MIIGFPTNTVILIIAVMVAVTAGAWLSLSRGVGQLSIASSVKRNWRWGAAIVLITWLLIRLALAVNPPGGTVLGTPFVIAFLGFGSLIGILPLLISLTFRQIVRAIPPAWLVGIHALRLGGFIFLALMDMRLLPAEFASPAGYGDMTVGLLALGIVYLLAARKPYARGLVIGWNLLGLLDFVVALVTGITYIGPFSARVAASGVSLAYLNYVLIIPTFAVPLFTALHVYSLFQVLSGQADETKGRIENPAHGPILSTKQPSVQTDGS